MATTIQTQHFDVTAEISSPYVKVADVKAGPLSVRVVRVTKEHFDANGLMPARDAYVLHFEGDPELKLVLNKTNLNAPVGNRSAGNFGSITGTQPAREIQFALRYAF